MARYRKERIMNSHCMFVRDGWIFEHVCSKKTDSKKRAKVINDVVLCVWASKTFLRYAKVLAEYKEMRQTI